MKRLIAAVSFAVATPVLAQPFGPTDPVMPSAGYQARAEHMQVAATEGYALANPVREQRLALGPTDPVAQQGLRNDASAGGTRAPAPAQYAERHIEWQDGYFDPSR